MDNLGAIGETRDKPIMEAQWFPTPHLGSRKQDPETCPEGSKKELEQWSSEQLLPGTILSQDFWVATLPSPSLQICPLDIASKTPVNLSLIFLLHCLQHRQKDNILKEERKVINSDQV